MPTNRRHLLVALALSGVALGATRLAAAPATLDLQALSNDTNLACLYHSTFREPTRFSHRLPHRHHHLSVYDFDTMRLKLVTVAHGAGMKFFLADRTGTPWEKDRIDETLYQRFVGLSKFGVEAYLCRITFQRNNIDLAKARSDSFLKFVPSGVAAVAELQGKGFAYLKCG